MRHLAVLCAVLVAIVSPASAVAQEVRTASTTARAAWKFDRSDLTPHPGVRFGVLPNGMRYALMRHVVPAGGLSVRLHFDAGASVEAIGQNGYMHLIEHLIFHGSANLPRGALLTMLPHAGMKRFADFRAVTSYDHTTYALDMAKADGRARETALTVMREIGHGMIFDRRTVAGAKAEVRAEIAGRDGAADRVESARNAFFFPGTPIARGSVLGTPTSVARADGDALRRLYERHYVPARATLVMVGDFDPAVAEAEIVGRMADRTGSRSEFEPLASVPVASGVRARLFVDRAARTEVTIAVVAPLGGADARAGRDAGFLAHLGAEMLARRLTRIAGSPGAPIAGGTSAVYDHLSTGRLASIDVTARDRDWRGALATGAVALKSVLEAGFGQAELDAQIAVSRRALAANAGPKTSAQIADGIADAVSRGIVYTAPTDASATDAYLAGVRLADINAAFRSAWASPGRLIFVAHDARIPGGDAAVLSAWNAVR